MASLQNETVSFLYFFFSQKAKKIGRILQGAYESGEDRCRKEKVMKNNPKKLNLNQETLRHLQDRADKLQLNCSIPRTEPFTVCLTCDCAVAH
jgi:hypothetical protein